MPRTRLQTRCPQAWLWALLYAMVLLVIAPSPEVRHGAEVQYLDTSLRMSLEGDWLVPRDPEGRPLIADPALAYWPMAISFKMFGPSMLSARLPFVLAGALTVWLIAWFGARLADRESGRIAAMCLAACLPWMLAGLRALPDIWLTLFLTLSAGGFLLLLNGSHRSSAPWLAWTGLGLAFATKGPEALLILPALAVVWWFWRGDVVWRDLLHRPAVMAGAGVGLLWYAAVAIRLGPSALPSLAGDGFQAAFTVQDVAGQSAWYLGFLPLALLPFSLLALGLKPADWRWLTRAPSRRATAAFAMVFALLLAFVFSLAGPRSPARDMLSALPWVALLVGMLFRSAIAAGRPRRWLGALTTGLVGALALVLVFAVAATGIAAGLVEGHESLVWRAGVLSLSAVAVLLAAHGGPRRALALPALMILVLPPVLFAVARPALPGAARDIVTAVEQADVPGPVLMAGNGSLAVVVRVMSGGRVAYLGTPHPLPGPDRFGTLVTAKRPLPDPGRHVSCTRRDIASDFRRGRPAELVSALRTRAVKAFLADRRRVYMMITCPPSEVDSTSPGAGP